MARIQIRLAHLVAGRRDRCVHSSPAYVVLSRPASLAKISLERKVTVALGFALVSLAAIGALQYRAARLFEGESQWVSRAQDVIRELDMALARLSDADASVQTFGLTGDTRQLFSFDKANQSISKHLQTVRNLTVDNAAQQQAFTRLQVQMADALARFKKKLGAARPASSHRRERSNWFLRPEKPSATFAHRPQAWRPRNSNSCDSGSI